jgi:uncharacterized protein
MIAVEPAASDRMRILRAVVSGILIAVVGVAPWIILAPLNRTFHPELPWAAVVVTLYLVVLLLWLNGGGWPRAHASVRRFNLRWWRPDKGAWSGENRTIIIGLMLLLVGMNVLWIAVSPEQPIADLSAYPTPAYRISILIMGALVSGVVEEAAFRGYLQSQLEHIGASFAIVVTSIVFVLMHITHGIAALLSVAPGYFVASMLYGLLAQRSGSIVPGMILHVLGDASHTFFVLLDGDMSRLTIVQ